MGYGEFRIKNNGFQHVSMVIPYFYGKIGSHDIGLFSVFRIPVSLAEIKFVSDDIRKIKTLPAFFFHIEIGIDISFEEGKFLFRVCQYPFLLGKRYVIRIIRVPQRQAQSSFRGFLIADSRKIRFQKSDPPLSHSIRTVGAFPPYTLHG
jgi:hypothetical protein